MLSVNPGTVRQQRVKGVPTLAGTPLQLTNPEEAAMKSAPLLLAPCLKCKTTAASGRENNRRAEALIHPSVCRLWDLGLSFTA